MVTGTGEGWHWFASQNNETMTVLRSFLFQAYEKGISKLISKLAYHSSSSQPRCATVHRCPITALIHLSTHQLRGNLDGLVDAPHDARSAVRGGLGEVAHVAGIEAEADNGVATPPLALVDDTADGVAAARVEHPGKPAQLPAGEALDDHAQTRRDVA